MNPHSGARPARPSLSAPTIEAARQSILRRLDQRLPGAGTLSVVPTVVQLHDVVVFTCKRSNRIGAVNLWVTMGDDPEALADRAVDELEVTQLHALEAPAGGRAVGA